MFHYVFPKADKPEREVKIDPAVVRRNLDGTRPQSLFGISENGRQRLRTPEPEPKDKFIMGPYEPSTSKGFKRLPYDPSEPPKLEHPLYIKPAEEKNKFKFSEEDDEKRRNTMRDYLASLGGGNTPLVITADMIDPNDTDRMYREIKMQNIYFQPDKDPLAVFDRKKGEVSVFVDGKRTKGWRNVDLGFGGEGLMDLRIDKSRLGETFDEPDYEELLEAPQGTTLLTGKQYAATASPERPIDKNLPQINPAPEEKGFFRRKLDAADATINRALNSFLGETYKKIAPDLSAQLKEQADMEGIRLNENTGSALERKVLSSVLYPLRLQQIADGAELTEKEVELFDKTLELNAGKIASSYLGLIGEKDTQGYLQEMNRENESFLEQNSPNKLEGFVREMALDPTTYVGGMGIAKGLGKKALTEGLANGAYTGAQVVGQDMSTAGKLGSTAAATVLGSVPGDGAAKGLTGDAAGETAEQLAKDVVAELTENKKFFDSLTKGEYNAESEIISSMVEFQRRSMQRANLPFEDGLKLVQDDIAKGMPPTPDDIKKFNLENMDFLEDYATGTDAENIISRITYLNVYDDPKALKPLMDEFNPNATDARKNFVGDLPGVVNSYEAYLDAYGGRLLLSPSYIKHVVGNSTEYAHKMLKIKNGDYPSILEHPNPQELLDRLVVNNRPIDEGDKLVARKVDAGEFVGWAWSNKAERYYPSTTVDIRYDTKGRAHFYPVLSVEQKNLIEETLKGGIK